MGEYMYSSGPVSNKKESKQRAAAAALMALAPDVYQNYLELQADADDSLSDLTTPLTITYTQPASIFQDEDAVLEALPDDLGTTPYALLHELYQKKMIPDFNAEIMPSGKSCQTKA